MNSISIIKELTLPPNSTKEDRSTPVKIQVCGQIPEQCKQNKNEWNEFYTDLNGNIIDIRKFSSNISVFINNQQSIKRKISDIYKRSCCCLSKKNKGNLCYLQKNLERVGNDVRSVSSELTRCVNDVFNALRGKKWITRETARSRIDKILQSPSDAIKILSSLMESTIRHKYKTYDALNDEKKLIFNQDSDVEIKQMIKIWQSLDRSNRADCELAKKDFADLYRSAVCKLLDPIVKQNIVNESDIVECKKRMTNAKKNAFKIASELIGRIVAMKYDELKEVQNESSLPASLKFKWQFNQLVEIWRKLGVGDQYKSRLTGWVGTVNGCDKQFSLKGF